MGPMKLPNLIKRTYKNKAGGTWIGYYYEPPRGSAGPGERAKPIALGSHTVTGKGPHTPPGEVLLAYSRLAKVDVAMPAAEGTIAFIYALWQTWAEAEVKAGRLARRSLQDYEEHWTALEPVFGAGYIDALTQPILLAYFDRRTSKDRGKREVNFLGQLCAWARARGRMTAPHPVDRGLRHQMKVDKREKAPVVSAETYWVVWHCADQLVRDTLDLSYMMGTRPTEALLVPMPAPGWTEIEAAMAKTKKSGRATKMVPQTPELLALIERRRLLQPYSLYVLFDEKGQQLRANGSIRSRLYKARDLAKVVCERAGIPWMDFTRQQLRPTAITQVDKSHGRNEARKLAGHSTDRQTASYVRHEAERVTPAPLPAAIDARLVARIEQIKADVARKEQQQ
jgi:hypothetical protein